MIHEKIKKLEIKNKMKTFFSNPKELFSYLVPILIAIILFIPVPYYVTIGGGSLNINNNIKIDNAYEEKGSFNSAYVSEVKGNVLFYLLSKVLPNYELEKIDNVTIGEENVKDYEFREKLSFTSSLGIATKVAYTKANKTIKTKEINYYIIYIDKDAETDIKVQDELLKINNKAINFLDDITSFVQKCNIDDVVNITILRDNKEIETTTKIIDIDGEKRLGVYLSAEYIFETNPKISLDFSNKESGPSGGLTIALSIYNKLVKEDITKGYKIVGTGTIDENGVVGEIGGVKYKLLGAIKSKADVFIVPMDNYEEAKKIIQEKNYKIKLLGVTSFEDAINKLKNL